MSNPMRLNDNLVLEAEKTGRLQKRSPPKQIEFWAELGKTLEHVIDMTDLLAVIQGIATIKVKPVQSVILDVDDVFAEVERDRASGDLAAHVTDATTYYEASVKYPGLLDEVSSTGRRTGNFRNGEFEEAAL